MYVRKYYIICIKCGARAAHVEDPCQIRACRLEAGAGEEGLEGGEEGGVVGEGGDSSSKVMALQIT